MNKLTVLLVDDHEGFINAAMRHFRKIDWLQIVGSAGNGLEALNAFSDAIGAPPKLLRPDEQVTAELAAEQQAQQNAQALAAAQQAAETGKTLADTQVTDPSALSELATAMRGGYA